MPWWGWAIGGAVAWTAIVVFIWALAIAAGRKHPAEQEQEDHAQAEYLREWSRQRNRRRRGRVNGH